MGIYLKSGRIENKSFWHENPQFLEFSVSRLFLQEGKTINISYHGKLSDRFG